MSAKFIHRRYITKPSKQDVERGREFSYDCRGGITIAYTWDAANRVVRLAVARCAPTDNFNRRVARDIALGRLQSKRPNRNHEIDLNGVPDLTSESVEDIVWGWLENQERMWDAEVTSHSVH
jgi:YD repeat-containing protein